MFSASPFPLKIDSHHENVSKLYIAVGGNSHINYTKMLQSKINQPPPLQVGSFNYDNTKMVFVDEFEYEDEAQVRSVLDYAVEIKKLPESQQNYVAITGNYSVAGFELTLRRKVSHYIITCYLPSGMFVIGLYKN